ncbi:MAG: N-formylglutamate amidohydrolase, partial [Syntrophobacteraceae bacterium]
MRLVAEHNPAGEQPFAILHIPHSSLLFPPDIRPTLTLSDAELAAELLRMTDLYTNELFRLDTAIAKYLVFPFSRLVVDPERFREDENEPMSEVGMGAVYTSRADGKPLRGSLTPDTREYLLSRFYDPHHQALSAVADSALGQWNACLIIDCHSFPSGPLPCDRDQSPDRPDICLGTDPFHTPPWLAAMAKSTLEEAFEAGNAPVKIEENKPLSGTIVPASCRNQDARVWSIMIQVNRALYMDE